MKTDWPIRWLLVALALAGLSCAAESARPPNIVVLLADDAAWGDFSFNGNTNLATPHVDRLAREGTVLGRFYVASVCSPTRAEFLTGRYYARTGVTATDSGRERLNLDEHTLAEAFQAAGYATGCFGKWHNGAQGPYHPRARGFDEFYGITEGHSGHYFDAPVDHNGRPERGHGYIADDFTDQALRFIAGNRDRPFFCYLPFNTPHTPFCVPDEYWNRFKDHPLALRAADGLPENPDATRCALAMCENLDWNVGRVLAQLEALGLAENTIVVFFSDNGPASWRWNGGLKGKKGTMDEGGVRSPFAIRWPGRIPAGATLDRLAAAIDLLPTLTRLAGIDRVGDKPLDGRDLSPVLLGSVPDSPERRLFSYTTWNQGVAVRTQRYLLDRDGALFDLAADPGQQVNVAGDHPDVVADLASAVAAWRADVFPGGAAPVRGPDDRPFPVGFAGLPLTILPAGDGVPHGGIRRSAKAPNSSFFTNWTNTADTITWNIEVRQSGDYDVALDYTCAAADVGAQIELTFNGARLTGTVAPAWDPPLITDEDRAPRPTESYLKDFHSLALGKIRLEAGRGLLTLRATRIPGGAVMDLAAVSLALAP